MRVEVFGPDKAFRPLTLANCLSEGMDRRTMEMGVVNLVEANGRMILFVNPGRMGKALSKTDADKSKPEDGPVFTWESLIRCQWYLIHVALATNEVTQKKGLILMSYLQHVTRSMINPSMMGKMVESMKGALPMRFSSDHVCHPPAIFSIIFPIISFFMSPLMRKRVKVHRGKPAKVLEELASYGLKKEELPTELGGDLVLDIRAWIQKRQEAEA